MDKVLEELIKTAPSTVAVIVVVVLFIRYLGKRDEMWTDMHNEHLNARELSRQAIEKNTVAMKENTESNIKLLDKLQEVKYFCPMNKQQQ